MSANHLRIAVRKFGPFEQAIRRQFDEFVRAEQIEATMGFDSLELNDLHPTIFDRGGMLDGTYDITFMVTDWLAAAVEQGLLADLAPLMKADPLPDYPAAWSRSLTSMPQIDGRLYGLPYHDGPEALIYRSDLIASPPKTWDEFLATMQRVANPTRGLWGTVVAAYPDGHNTVYDFSLHLWTRGGELLDPAGNPSLDTPEARQALDFYRRLVRNPATVPNARAIHSVPAGERFMQGEVAMMINWFGFAAMCQTLNESRVRGKVGIAPIPAGAPPRGASASLNVYWMLSIAAGSKNKPLAWRFLKHCASAEMDKLLTLAGAVGCRLSTWNDPQVNAAIPFFKQLPALHENARSFPLDRRFPGLGQAIERGVLRAIDTDDPVESITRDMQSDAMNAWAGTPRKGHSNGGSVA
ncbi:ABC transporter substrate-binding protein [Fontivita pretiosa]|uniref:ABC transporter substrate-binding protein n=1 Tax=Fontivita pretiosa TaxID=2989684 RepID=UPI003D167B70